MRVRGVGTVSEIPAQATGVIKHLHAFALGRLGCPLPGIIKNKAILNISIKDFHNVPISPYDFLKHQISNSFMLIPEACIQSAG